LPLVVVSGLPNITPIFMRIWLMKITMQLVFLMVDVSLRSVWLHQPRLQAGQQPFRLRTPCVSVPTESMTIKSTAP
jgi:hypothetical protein